MRFAIVFVLVLTGCPFSDTCSEGPTFENPHLANGIETIDGKDALRVQWTTPTSGIGSELPESYFASPNVSGADSASATGPEEITVIIGDLAARLGTSNDLVIQLAFGDRRGVVSCKHPGADDTYLLDITLTFATDGSLAHTTVVEGIDRGPI
jgi:hypothetical protein